MKRLFWFLTVMVATQIGGAIHCFGDKINGEDTVAITAADIHDGIRLYIETVSKDNNGDYSGRYMVAYPNIQGENSVQINDALTDGITNSLWQLEATGQNDAIYTDKPTYYLKDLTSGKYFGGTSLTSLKQADKQMVEGKTMAFSFCVLSAADIKNKENITMNTQGNNNAVFFHHSNLLEDGSTTWFRLVRFGGYAKVYFFSTNEYPTHTGYSAMRIYTPDIPNYKKAAAGIAELKSYYDEILPLYQAMSSPTYDDAALTDEQIADLKDALDNADTALETIPSGEDSYYTDLKAALQTVYEKVPFVRGGRSRWLISADSVAAGKQVIFQLNHYVASDGGQYHKYMYVNPSGEDGKNAVMVNGDSIAQATVWELVSAGATDAYTNKLTYYLKDTSTGLYLGTSNELSYIDTSTNTNTNTSNYKQMVDTTDKAYKFSIIDLDEANTLDKNGATLNDYDNPNSVVIQYTYDAGNWMRLARFGGYEQLFCFAHNDQWAGWNMYTAESNYSIAYELATAIADYGSLTFSPVGSDPGEYDKATVESYNDAVSAAKAVSASTTRAQIRALIDNLKTQYDVASALKPNAVTDGYYYIMSALTGVSNEVAYDPNNGNDKVGYHTLDADSKYDVFHIVQTATGQYTVQNLGSGKYVGQAYDDNYVSLVDSVPTATYQRFVYHTQAQYYWNDSGTTYTYYRNNTSARLIGRYYKQNDASAFDAWYLKTVPQSTIDKFNGATYEDSNGSLAATGSISVAGLQSVLEANSDITSIDLTKATLPADLTGESLSDMMRGNQVAYVPEGSVIKGDNIVVGQTCDNLVLADKTTFAPAKTFTATNATITRQLYPGLNTVCLPFSFTASDIKNATDVQIYVYASAGDNTVTFNVADEVEAGQAAIVSIGGTGDEAAQYTITKAAAPIAVTPVEDNVIKGTFTRLTPGEGAYKLNQDGTAFVQTTATSTVLPFRFYMKPPVATSASFSLILSDDDDPTGISDAKGSYTYREIRAVYDAAGHLLQSPKKGINIFRYSDGTTQKIYVK